MSPCAFNECPQPVRSSGLCKNHYQQQRRGRKLVPLKPNAGTTEQRFHRKVSKGASCWDWIGAKNTYGYGEMRIAGKLVAAHRLSYEINIGAIPEGLVVDHKCHNKSCVRPSHLRAVTYKANAENRSGPRAGSKSGVWGVSWHKKSRKWCVRVRHNSMLHYGGYYTDLEEAAAAAKALRLSLFQFNDLDRRSA